MTLLEDSANWPDFEQATGNVYLPSFRVLDEYRPWVVLATEKCVAKFARSWPNMTIDKREEYLRRLGEELTTAKEVCEAGLNAPKPEGLFRVPRRDLYNPAQNDPAFVMKFIQGRTMLELDFDNLLSSNIKYLWQEELAKARKLGFENIDDDYSNAIYSPEENKVYLIDFDCWVRR